VCLFVCIREKSIGVATQQRALNFKATQSGNQLHQLTRPCILGPGSPLFKRVVIVVLAVKGQAAVILGIRVRHIGLNTLPQSTVVTVQVRKGAIMSKPSSSSAVWIRDDFLLVGGKTLDGFFRTKLRPRRHGWRDHPTFSVGCGWIVPQPQGGVAGEGVSSFGRGCFRTRVGHVALGDLRAWRLPRRVVPSASFSAPPDKDKGEKDADSPGNKNQGPGRRQALIRRIRVDAIPENGGTGRSVVIAVKQPRLFVGLQRVEVHDFFDQNMGCIESTLIVHEGFRRLLCER
jgi:hypothetical protein